MLYGSDLADQAFSANTSPTPIMTKRIQLLKQTARALRPIEDGHTTELLRDNTIAWTTFLTDFALLELGHAFDAQGSQESLGAQITAKWKELTQLLDANADVNLKSLLLVGARIAFESLNLKQPGLDYNNNIRRFQLLTREAIVAAQSLTTSSRLQWWQENTIPVQGIRSAFCNLIVI